MAAAPRASLPLASQAAAELRRLPPSHGQEAPPRRAGGALIVKRPLPAAPGPPVVAVVRLTASVGTDRGTFFGGLARNSGAVLGGAGRSGSFFRRLSSKEAGSGKTSRTGNTAGSGGPSRGGQA